MFVGMCFSASMVGVPHFVSAETVDCTKLGAPTPCDSPGKATSAPDDIKFSYPPFGKDINLNGKDPSKFDIQRSDISSFEQFGSRFISFMSGVVVLITILVFMIGSGFWIFSSGNESLVERGKDMMIYSTIGILMVLGAYVIVKVVQVILYSLGT